MPTYLVVANSLLPKTSLWLGLFYFGIRINHLQLYLIVNYRRKTPFDSLRETSTIVFSVEIRIDHFHGGDGFSRVHYSTDIENKNNPL